MLLILCFVTGGKLRNINQNLKNKVTNPKDSTERQKAHNCQQDIDE